MKALKDTIFEKLSINDINIRKSYGKFVSYRETANIIDSIRDNTINIYDNKIKSIQNEIENLKGTIPIYADFNALFHNLKNELGGYAAYIDDTRIQLNNYELAEKKYKNNTDIKNGMQEVALKEIADNIKYCNEYKDKIDKILDNYLKNEKDTDIRIFDEAYDDFISIYEMLDNTFNEYCRKYEKLNK